MEPLLIAALGGALVLWLLLERLPARYDAREPARRFVGVPIIGNLVAMAQYGVRSYAIASGKNAPSVFTWDLFLTKFYIITTSELMLLVQRNSKAISFEPLLAPIATRLCGMTEHALRCLKSKEIGGDGVNDMITKAMHHSLLGKGLEKMNEAMVQYVNTINDQMGDQTGPFDLYLWCRHVITVASTDAVYGPMNPYRDPEIEEAFWICEMNTAALMLNIFPSITARKGYLAREKMVRAFVRYYEQGGMHVASELTRNRWEAMSTGGLGVEDAARGEATLGIGLLSNSAPVTFFMLYDIFSRPELLAQLRAEIGSKAVIIEQRDGTDHQILDLGLLRHGCPHLLSTFQEILRVRMQGAATRMVTRDIQIDQYLFKKDNIVQVPAIFHNYSAKVWGPDAGCFNSKRFLTKNPSSSSSARAQGFVSFGMSPYLCPGRHFATGEILALVATIVLNFDIEPRGGTWNEPRPNLAHMSAAIAPPKGSFIVNVTPKNVSGSTHFQLGLTDGRSKFDLVVG